MLSTFLLNLVDRGSEAAVESVEEKKKSIRVPKIELYGLSRKGLSLLGSLAPVQHTSLQVPSDV
jgi:hypothetical protein